MYQFIENQVTNPQKTFYEQELERIAMQHLLTENLHIRVRKAKHFMQNSLSKKIDLKDIAASAAMSRFHFIRIFQQIYGVSPRLFLRDLRITRAKDLIKVGCTVTQTCHDVGYESLTTFSGTFKRCTGVSPIAYRKLNFSNREEVVR